LVTRVTCMGYMGIAYTNSLGEPEGKGHLGNKSSCDNNIKIDLRETGWYGVYWVHPNQGRAPWQAVVNKVRNIGLYKRLGIS